MAACAENLVPVLMELGGKDAMIVDDDADVVAAADAAVWGAMSNAGQTCIGIERVYATSAVYDRFVAEVTEQVRKLRPGSDDEATYGPMTMASQGGIVRRHVEDAESAGGRVVRGDADPSLFPNENFLAPTVLLDVPEDVRRHPRGDLRPDADRSRRCATPRRRSSGPTPRPTGWPGRCSPSRRPAALDLARRMRSGMTSVNSVLTFASVPALPFGGVGDSGFGRIHGEDGLKEFTRAKAITRQRVALPVNLMSFSRPASATDAVARVMGMIHGRHR